ncbi:hypothetical protein D9619_012465 [Psilocybe cf. subviscida]|uniref:DEAD/DEAH box helicase domain-containing protein n=1 Tax=Psilocybe cf. subviscida TaxID=2480587 RepID=A0A8H5AR99_9AGAR|nr:hypothetical protein D9619_012465 [Psilocybe cf. subviscida]
MILPWSSPPAAPSRPSIPAARWSGPDAHPGAAALSLKHLISSPNSDSKPVPAPVAAPSTPGWRQFLLTSETGTGKSIAYLLLPLQAVKKA